MNPDTLPQCERAYLGLEMPWPRLPAGNAHPSSVCVAVSIMRVHRGPRDLGDRAGRLLHAATPRLLSRYSRQQRPVSLDSCRCGLVPVVRDFQGPFWTALAPTQMSRNMPTWKHACLRSAVQQPTWPDPATLAWILLASCLVACTVHSDRQKRAPTAQRPCTLRLYRGITTFPRIRGERAVHTQESAVSLAFSLGTSPPFQSDRHEHLGPFS